MAALKPQEVAAFSELKGSPFHGVLLRGRIEARPREWPLGHARGLSTEFYSVTALKLLPRAPEESTAAPLSTEFYSVAALKQIRDGQEFGSGVAFHGVLLRGRIEAAAASAASACSCCFFPRSSTPWPH